MPNADEIVELVDNHFTDTQLLRDRMDADYDDWKLEEYTGAGEDYQNYTTNEPRTYGKKNVTMLSGAKMSVRTPQDDDPREERAKDNAKERFYLGNFRANDQRLAQMDQQPLRAALSWYVPIRGRTMGRAMLMKNTTGKVWADATPWDPRNVAWGMGANGLSWICHRHRVLRSVAKKVWKKELRRQISESGESSEEVTFYDFYDEETNGVVIPELEDRNKFAKVLTRHGMMDGFGEPRVPAWIATSTLEPMILTEINTWGESLANYGESIYADNRKIWEDYRLLVSIMLELAARGRKPVLLITSLDGTKTLEIDPFRQGATLSLAQGDKVEVLDMLSSAGDMGPLLALISGEMQRGGFPSIVFGESFQAISGFAMNTLRGSVSDKVIPLAMTIETALTQIGGLWTDHFMTGAFSGEEGMSLAGQGSNRRWFSTLITPDMIRDVPEPIITITPQIPQDDAGKMQLATLASQPGGDGLPLLSHQRILESYLEVQDSDMEIDAIFLEKSQTMHPEALLYTLFTAAANRGDENIARIYFSEWWQIVQQRLGQGVPSGMGGLPGQEQGGGGGLSPETAPPETLGVPANTPGVNTPAQQGPLVPPGTPRPGANGRNV